MWGEYRICEVETKGYQELNNSGHHCISQNQKLHYKMIQMFLGGYFLTEKENTWCVRCGLSLQSEKVKTFSFMCSYLSQIYYNAHILFITKGKLVFLASNSMFTIPNSETCFHLKSFYCSGSFFFHTHRPLCPNLIGSRINYQFSGLLTSL